LHIYVSFFGFRFLVSVLERHALIALAAVTLHDAMQLVRLSKPRSAAKYSLNGYFFCRQSVAMSEHVAISPNEAADRLAIRELVEAYAHCADRRDAKNQMALFAEDAHFEQSVKAIFRKTVTQPNWLVT